MSADANPNAKSCGRCGKRPPAGNHRWCRPCQNAARRTLRRRSREGTTVARRTNGDQLAEPEVFARVAGTLPRGDVTLLLRAILYDEREEIYKQLVRGCRKSPTFALAALKEAADRIHGKPQQHVVAETRRVTNFYPEPPRDLKREAEEAAAEVVETVAEAPVVELTSNPMLRPGQPFVEAAEEGALSA